MFLKENLLPYLVGIITGPIDQDPGLAENMLNNKATASDVGVDEAEVEDAEGEFDEELLLDAYILAYNLLTHGIYEKKKQYENPSHFFPCSPPIQPSPSMSFFLDQVRNELVQAFGTKTLLELSKQANLTLKTQTFKILHFLCGTSSEVKHTLVQEGLLEYVDQYRSTESLVVQRFSADILALVSEEVTLIPCLSDSTSYFSADVPKFVEFQILQMADCEIDFSLSKLLLNISQNG